MTALRVLAGCGAFLCAIILLFWSAWSFEHLSGWAALPIGLSVAATIYAIGSLLIMVAAGILDNRK